MDLKCNIGKYIAVTVKILNVVRKEIYIEYSFAFDFGFLNWGCIFVSFDRLCEMDLSLVLALEMP